LISEYGVSLFEDFELCRAFDDPEMNPCRIDTAAIEQARTEFLALTSVTELRDYVVQFLKSRVFVPPVLSTNQMGPRSDLTDLMKDGWFPFTGENLLDPETGLHFDPPMSHILNEQGQPVNIRNWGGNQNAMYTKRGLLACLVIPDSVTEGRQLMTLLASGLGATGGIAGISNDIFTWKWEQIGVLTDGTAGSAASNFATKLQLSRYATAFTFGGIVGEQMDSSSFAGGNVEQYEQWWPRVVYAAMLGNWMTDYRSIWNEMWENDTAGLARPLPTTASVAFNFNMNFPTELGPDALPRQYYSIPAHKHFDFWARGLGIPGLGPNPGKLAELYRLVVLEDWCYLRRQPTAVGAKGSEDCTLPDRSGPSPVCVPTTTPSTTTLATTTKVSSKASTTTARWTTKATTSATLTVTLSATMTASEVIVDYGTRSTPCAVLQGLLLWVAGCLLHLNRGELTHGYWE